MGFWDRLLGRDQPASYEPAQIVQPEPYEPYYATAGLPVMDPGTPLEEYLQSGGYRSGIERFWKTQPNLRKVVDFVARNVSSIPLNTFERISDTDRRRLRGEPLADLMRNPRRGVGAYRFWHAVISDGLLYARWAVMWATAKDGKVELLHIPSWRLRFDMDPLRRITGIRYWAGDSLTRGDQWIDVPMESVIYDVDYAPRTAGLSPVETLRDILDENVEAVKYRRQLWANGVRTPAYVTRPTGVQWGSEERRQRVIEQIRAAYTADGTNAGGMPLLEDGMEIRALDVFAPQSMQDIQGRQLTAIEVAAAYHIAPELVGAREGTFSNIDAFRQMLWGVSLGGYITAWEQAINATLVPALAGDRDVYVEANVEGKLRGSFVEQTTIMQSAVGAPWMSRNEARAMQNRPPMPGGDELVTPLNVLIGGQASPRDSAPKTARAEVKDAAVRIKGSASEPHAELAASVLRAFFKRQAASVLSAMGAKAGPSWWDQKRWDRELSDSIYGLAMQVTADVASETLDLLGFDPGDYDSGQTTAFLRAVAQSRAGMINAATLRQLANAADPDSDTEPVDVFDAAQDSRSDIAGATLATTLTGFAVIEAAKQVAPNRATKTWVVTSGNPRPSHAAMDGETVAVNDVFSNGAAWPGDPVLGVDGVAGCTCDVVTEVS